MENPLGSQLEFETPDHWEPVTLSRTWFYIKASSGTVYGYGWMHRWNPGDNEAKCFRTESTLDKVGIEKIIKSDLPIKDALKAIVAGRQPVHDKLPAPQSQCTCGFYGLNKEQDPDLFLSMAEKSRYYRVYGWIDVWGRAVKHHLGYRAQYARIKAIWLGPDMNAFLSKTVADFYKVPLLVGPYSEVVKELGSV